MAIFYSLIWFKMKRKFQTFIIITLVFFFACSGGDDNPPKEEIVDPVNMAPSKVDLIYPSENLLCIDNLIAFNWSPSVDPENDVVKYKITIAKNRSLTDLVEDRVVSGTTINITLENGVAYYWRITPEDLKDNIGESSSVFAFYTEGIGVSNYAPFTAEIISPDINSSINAGTISLNWKGADTNTEDVLTYELFFGEATDPALVSSDLTAETSDVIVESGKTYYWKINTLDNFGAKTIGQIWSFNVN